MTALLLGLLTALVLFWAVGAHNRLVRLRASVRDQWLVIDAAWIKLIAPLQGRLSAHLAELPPGPLHGRAEQLSAACEELIDALTQARQRPLEATPMHRVLAARAQLALQMHQALGQDTPAAWPELVSLQLRMWQQLPALVGQYHRHCRSTTRRSPPGRHAGWRVVWGWARWCGSMTWSPDWS